MDIDFQQCRRWVQSREITITSWYDNRTNTWSASAPGYVHVFCANVDAPRGFASRNSAIERMVSVLTDHFKKRV